MLASPASTTVRTSNGVDVELERVDRARGVLRLADRPRPEAGARPVADGVVERRADDRDVDGRARRSSAGIGDPRQVHERRRADVGRQVEVGVRLELAVPAVGSREVGRRGSWGRSATGSSGDGRGWRIAGRGQVSVRLDRGRRRFEVRSSSGARRGRW